METSLLRRENNEKCWKKDITRKQGFMTKTSSLNEEDLKNFKNCLDYFTQRSFNNESVTEDEKEFQVAYSCKWYTLKTSSICELKCISIAVDCRSWKFWSARTSYQIYMASPGMIIFYVSENNICLNQHTQTVWHSLCTALEDYIP